MAKILWADDEIDLLRPHLNFLTAKGHDIVAVSNGHDALEELQQQNDFDIIFLDESMPGLTGLETLSRIKASYPLIPIVMITKNEAEDVMEAAIGNAIANYLTKPVNPSQINSTIITIMENTRLVRQNTVSDFQKEFRILGNKIDSASSTEAWVEAYLEIIRWELRLDDSDSTDMMNILSDIKKNANANFNKFIRKNYLNWMQHGEGPSMSHQLMQKKVLAHINKDRPTLFLLLDNLRFDQWKIIEPLISESYRVEEEDYFFSMLPTATQYSRNAIFAGLTPLEISKKYPQWWLNDFDEGGKNQYERELFGELVNRVVRKPVKFDYIKVSSGPNARQVEDNILNYLNNDITLLVYNFIDMLSHNRTEMFVLKELVPDEKGYRDLTRTWFQNSPLWAALRMAAKRKMQLIITTDHGTIRVNRPVEVGADRDTSTNLRYKAGKNINPSKGSDLFTITEPQKAGLPSPNMTTSYVFTKEDQFLLYPNNYNEFKNKFAGSFQHGGISMEEMICPFIRLSPK
jgi:CheY-like chemotaxis protein